MENNIQRRRQSHRHVLTGSMSDGSWLPSVLPKNDFASLSVRHPHPRPIPQYRPLQLGHNSTLLLELRPLPPLSLTFRLRRIAEYSQRAIVSPSTEVRDIWVRIARAREGGPHVLDEVRVVDVLRLTRGLIENMVGSEDLFNV